MEPEALSHEVKSQPSGAPPRLPPICGDFHIRIDRNGTWYYLNSPIGRLALAKLFATVLRREADGSYWLTTPAENGRIEVEDVPFVAVELTTEGHGRRRTVSFRTNLDDVVTLGPDHPLRMGSDGVSGAPAPYVLIRAGLEARLARSVYYHLVDISEPSPHDGEVLGVWSQSLFFPIGATTDGGPP